MEEVISTIYYNGQFWVALIEKIGDDGSLKVGKYTFGPEPTNTDLIHFYQNIYPYLSFYETGERFRIKEKRSIDEQSRCTKKSLVLYSACRGADRELRRKERGKVRHQEQDEKYRKKAARKKEKKRGH